MIRTRYYYVTAFLLLPILSVDVTGALTSYSTYQNKELDEYCQFESFDVKCAPNEVIVVHEASYGRMKIGRCVTRNYGYIKCSSSVLDIVDKWCSGNQSCVFEISALRDLVQPCPKDLTAYLEATHTCVKVLNQDSSVCAASRGIETISTSGYISSLHTVAGGVASKHCPLHIYAKPGQYVNLTLYNFGHYHDASSRQPCPYYAVVEENKHTKNISLCKAATRVSQLYSSHTSDIRFYFGGSKVASSRFLVQYKVGGCATMQAPPDGWVERTDNKAVIRCNHSKEIWYLTCELNKWIGSFSNCSESQPLNVQKAVVRRTAFPYGLIVAITIGVVLGVAIGTVMLITVFIYRRRRKREQSQHKPNALLSDHDGVQDNEENYARRPCLAPQDIYHKGGGDPCNVGQSCCVGRGAQLCGDYTQMMELRCATPCSPGDIYAERRACNRHVSFSDNGPSLSLHSLNIPTSFATFKPQTDLESTYDRSKRPMPAPHRTYPTGNQRVNIGANSQQQTPPPPPPPAPQQQQQQPLQPLQPLPHPHPHQQQQPQQPNRNINCDYSLFNYDQDPDNNDPAQPDLVSSNHVEGTVQGQAAVANQSDADTGTHVLSSAAISAIVPPPPVEQCHH